jgi:hypothetical protein
MMVEIEELWEVQANLSSVNEAEGGAGAADLRGGRGHSGEEGRRWCRGVKVAEVVERGDGGWLGVRT